MTGRGALRRRKREAIAMMPAGGAWGRRDTP
jgi:hypothetical protein